LTVITLPLITTHNGDGKFQNQIPCSINHSRIFTCALCDLAYSVTASNSLWLVRIFLLFIYFLLGFKVCLC